MCIRDSGGAAPGVQPTTTTRPLNVTASVIVMSPKTLGSAPASRHWARAGRVALSTGPSLGVGDEVSDGVGDGLRVEAASVVWLVVGWVGLTAGGTCSASQP